MAFSAVKLPMLFSRQNNPALTILTYTWHTLQHRNTTMSPLISPKKVTNRYSYFMLHIWCKHVQLYMIPFGIRTKCVCFGWFVVICKYLQVIFLNCLFSSQRLTSECLSWSKEAETVQGSCGKSVRNQLRCGIKTLKGLRVGKKTGSDCGSLCDLVSYISNFGLFESSLPVIVIF